MGFCLDRIRTIFWSHRVLEIEGLGGVLSGDKELKKKLSETLQRRYNIADPSRENEALHDAVYESFSDKSIWRNYLAGGAVPKHSKEGALFTSQSGIQTHPYIVNIVEMLFPEVEGLFESGPYGLISVLECDNTEDALQQYEESLSKFAKNSSYTKKTFDVHPVGPNIEDVEVIDYILTWSDIKKWLKQEPHRYFEILNRFLPDIDVDQKWNKENEYSLFFHIISSYIEARFLKKIPYIYSNIAGADAGRLGQIAIHDNQTGSESGILYFEKCYGLDRNIWFDKDLDSSPMNVFDIARKNAISFGPDFFPDLKEFDLGNEQK